MWAIYIAALVVAMYTLPLMNMPLGLQIIFALAVITPLGPQMYRTFSTIGSSKALGAADCFNCGTCGNGRCRVTYFGPDGAQTKPFSEAIFEVGALAVNSQTLFIVAAFLIMIIALWYFFEKHYMAKLYMQLLSTEWGTINGNFSCFAGKLTFSLAAFIGALSGILIAPITTLYYDSGFVISLKGFVGAIIGGLVSFPVAALGAVAVGIIEAFAMFWASDYKEIIVFTLIIPFLLWKSLTSRQIEEESE